MERSRAMLLTSMVLSITLVSAFSFDYDLSEGVFSFPIGINTVDAAAPEGVAHTIEMEAVQMPDGMYAYRMVSYTIDDDRDGNADESLVAMSVEDISNPDEDIMIKDVHDTDPQIPGPTLVFTEGDTAIVTLRNAACGDNFIDGPSHPLGLDTYSENSMVGIHVHGVHYGIDDDASYKRMNMADDSGALCGSTFTYEWNVGLGTEGTWPYHDHTFYKNEVGAEDLGLFGTVIVNPHNGKIDGIVDSVQGNVKKIDVDDIDKEFVLWMVSSEVLGKSIFYGMEIDNNHSKTLGKQTALWTNPPLYAEEGTTVRYHVLGIGDETHAFHLHGHRWIDTTGGPADIIDVKEITPLQRHTFVIEVSDNAQEKDDEQSEGWMYHCHVFSHMQEGMSGMMMVVENAELPDIGAVFTLSDEPGNWMKTLNAGNLEDIDNILNEILAGVHGQEIADQLTPATDGTGFAPKYLGVLEEGFYDNEGRSIAVINPGETVLFGMKDSQTKHTITTLIYPVDAERIGGNGILRMADFGHYDQQMGIRGTAILSGSDGTPVGLETPGLYVFVCKIHPYMFSAVVVDNPETFVKATELGIDEFPLLDLSPKLEILTRHYTDTNNNGVIDPENGDLKAFPIQVSPATTVPLTLLKTFSIIVDPSNWKDYTQDTWEVSMIPGLFTTNSNDVLVTLLTAEQATAAAGVIGLAHGEDGTFALELHAGLSHTIEDIQDELDYTLDDGVGEVLINTQFERTVNKNFDGTAHDKPGTITVVNTSGDWDVDRKFALPEINMNHPHNMWVDDTNELIYQTQWFGTEMAIIERDSGELVKEVFAGQSPSHVMTSPTTGKIYIAMNGEDTVNEFDPDTFELTKQISTGFRSHPHGHWVSTTGQYVVTPDFLGLKASIINLENNTVIPSAELLLAPIATGMKADESEFFTADFLGNSNSQVNLDGTLDSDRFIDWIDYDVGLPIQTPISPDDKWMVTALTLGGKIAVVDVSEDPPVVKEPLLDCDPGCHGVQWGAKQGEGEGYYAYVTSKFSNALIVVDPELNEVVGKISLADRSAENDDRIIGYDGMGGQGVLAIPNVYDGWIQKTVEVCESNMCSDDMNTYLFDGDEGLNDDQRNPNDDE